MSKENDLQNAINLLLHGRRSEAAKMLLVLEPKITDKKLRLKLIDSSLSALDSFEYGDKLLRLCEEAIKISKNFKQDDSKAYFMSRKADLLMSKVTFLRYEHQNLKLAPSWFGFSTEAEKKRYEELSNEIEKAESEIDSLLKQSMALAEQGSDKRNVARILMASAAVDSTRYLQCKTKCMRESSRMCMKMWIKFGFMRYPFFENLFIFPRKKVNELQLFVNAFTGKLEKAAHLFEEAGDSAAGYAYCNLANDFKTTYRFFKARKYLKKAKKIADKYNDLLLKKQVEVLMKSVKEKNKDIPNYLNGETRED